MEKNKGGSNDISYRKSIREIATLEAADAVTKGKEILIKVVAYAIPTYIIDCFKVPKKCYEEMNSAVAKFRLVILHHIRWIRRYGKKFGRW